MLPKLHKKGVPGRPICSPVNHPTSRISKLVDEHIKEYVPKRKSYIRDTQDFIKNIKSLGPIPEGAILCTLDVSSLYTNIPNNEGIVAVAAKLRQDPTKGPITNFILDLSMEFRKVLFWVRYCFHSIQHHLVKLFASTRILNSIFMRMILSYTSISPTRMLLRLSPS